MHKMSRGYGRDILGWTIVAGAAVQRGGGNHTWAVSRFAFKTQQLRRTCCGVFLVRRSCGSVD